MANPPSPPPTISSEEYSKFLDILLEFINDVTAHAVDRRDPQLEDLAKSWRKYFHLLIDKRGRS